jgi:hypothetical protein
MVPSGLLDILGSDCNVGEVRAENPLGVFSHQYFRYEGDYYDRSQQCGFGLEGCRREVLRFPSNKHEHDQHAYWYIDLFLHNLLC